MGLIVTTGACRPSRFADASWHPLVSGNPPQEATGWGQNKYYVFVEVGDFRFIWCATSAQSEGFWFCEVADGTQVPENLKLDNVTAREAKDEEIEIIRGSDAFRALQREHTRKAFWESEDKRWKAEQAQWIRDHPEEWAKMQEEHKRQHEEMEKRMNERK